MAKILLIDDEEMIRMLFAEYLESMGYETVKAVDGKDGIEVFGREKPDIVITDLNMPKMTGLDVIKNIKALNSDIPIIVISGVQDTQEMLSAVHLGAWDYIVKPVEELQEIEYSIVRCLERAHLIKENRRISNNIEDEVKLRMESFQDELQRRVAAVSLLRQSLDNLTRVTDQVINTLSIIGDIRDPYTGGHQQRVARLAKAIAERMNLDKDFVRGIYIGALLHDIGKISVPLEILSKPGLLSIIEREMIKIHPKVGFDILKGIEFPWPIHQIALQHHERLNGSGYPDGIKGDDILPEARIISVADVVESISSHRPYRPALGVDMAIREIKKNSKILYDQEAAICCIKLLEEGFSFA